MENPSFTCNCADAGRPFPHFWEHTVGSGHATLALRADWQAQMRRCHEELGFRHVRFHGLLSDGMGTFVVEQDKPLYSFFNADTVFDFLLSIGMKPFVELSFMPSALSSGDKMPFHYASNVTAPRDYGAWAELVRKLAAHWIARYGAGEVRQWFFEVWNEPNLEAFGSGRQEDYFKLYRHTARALKEADAGLKVGGPATAMNAWVPEFLKFCESGGLPADFVSTHHYPTDAFGAPGDDTETQLSKSRRSVLREQAAAVRAQAGGRPVYYTEWCSSSNPRDPLHDQPYAAAFLVKTVMEASGLVEGYSWWVFSDIFEENYFPSQPFHGGFGLMNIHGIPKPSYRAFQLLHGLGDRLLPVAGAHETVDCWVTRAEGRLTVLATNFALPRHPVREETVRITLENCGENCGTPSRATLRRIDDGHANARKSWLEMGSPRYLKKEDVAALEAASALEAADMPFSFEGGALTLELRLPPQGIAAVDISCGGGA